VIGRTRGASPLVVEAGLALAMTAALAAALYAGTLRYPLLFDSVGWFSEANLRSLRDLATTDRYVSKKATYWLVQAAGGRMPLVRAAHAGVHALTTATLFLLVRQLLARALPARASGAAAAGGGTALAVAALFTVHPVNVYAVADPGQMELVLGTLFSVVMLLAFLEGLARPSRWLLLASAVFYGLAVLSKENLIPMPAVALAMVPLVHRPSWSVARRLWPWGALVALIAIWIAVAEVRQARPEPPFDVRAAAAVEHGSADALRVRSAITQGAHFFRYAALWLAPWPGAMSIDLQRPLAASVLAWPQTVGFVAFCLYPVGATWLLARGGRAGVVGFGLLWPWLLFLPELAAVRITEGFVLYRGYPWMIGALLALAVALAPRLARWAWPVACVACAGLAAVAHERLGTFRSTYAVWDDAVDKNRADERRSPAAFRAYLNRGDALLRARRAEPALADFDTALELRPGLTYAHVNRGIALVALQRQAEALAAFDDGVAAAGEIPPRARARARSNRAALLLLLGRPRDALADLLEAAALDPSRADYRLNAERLRAEIGS
jgi:hypothetical protein